MKYVTEMGLRWVHEKWFRHSSNIKVITATISEAVILVLLIGAIYEACC
jgi:hypothetical protein